MSERVRLRGISLHSLRPRIRLHMAGMTDSVSARSTGAAGVKEKGVVVDLLDEEIRHVGARDEPACPVARIGQRAIGVSLRPIGQDHGTHDHPVELAPTDDALLYVLVVIDTPQQQVKSHVIKKPAVAAAITGASNSPSASASPMPPPLTLFSNASAA